MSDRVIVLVAGHATGAPARSNPRPAETFRRCPSRTMSPFAPATGLRKRHYPVVMEVHPIGPEGIDRATATISMAFRHDPVWGVALGGHEIAEDHHRSFWMYFVEGGHRYNTVFESADAGTVSVWIPPGGTEMSPGQESALREYVQSILEPAQVRALFELWDRFDQHHPHDEPHAYLSLLATRPDLAGHGYGQAHLATDLGRWDSLGLPTYLESSNPRNNHRYEKQGYRKVGQFETVLDAAPVTMMWRPVGG
jgi:GNAT superfamily N-acetyltransferase